MRQILRDLIAALRECFRPTWEHEDETDLKADAAKRAEWVREHQHPPETS